LNVDFAYLISKHSAKGFAPSIKNLLTGISALKPTVCESFPGNRLLASQKALVYWGSI
jgi:hypothetical protein